MKDNAQVRPPTRWPTDGDVTKHVCPRPKGAPFKLTWYEHRGQCAIRPYMYRSIPSLGGRSRFRAAGAPRGSLLRHSRGSGNPPPPRRGSCAVAVRLVPSAMTRTWYHTATRISRCMSSIRRYVPCLASSSLWVPRSTIRPPSRTRISSICSMRTSLWVMTSVARSCVDR